MSIGLVTNYSQGHDCAFLSDLEICYFALVVIEEESGLLLATSKKFKLYLNFGKRIGTGC